MKRGNVPSFFASVQKKQKVDIPLVENAEDYELPSDVEVALAALKSRLPAEIQPPFVLKTQILHLVHDSTSAERELERLREGGIIRILKLASSSDDFIIVENRIFLETIKRVFPTVQELEPSLLPALLMLADTNRGLLVTKADVAAVVKPPEFAERLIGAAGKLGLFLKRDGEGWWWALPGAGPLIKWALAGRQELTKYLQRSRFKEQPEATVLAKKMRSSALPAAFHLTDLLGRRDATLVDWGWTGDPRIFLVSFA